METYKLLILGFLCYGFISREVKIYDPLALLVIVELTK